jgi:phage-related protein
MSTIGSLASGYINPLTGLGAYERNVKAFGPVVATAIGAADATSGVCQSTCSFSSDALSALDDWVDQGVDTVASVGDTLAGAAQAVQNGVGDSVDGLEGALDSIVDTVTGAAQGVADTVGDAVESVEDFVSDAADAVSDATDAVVGGAGDLFDGIVDTLDTVAGYAAMGALSIGQALNEAV